MPLAATRHGHDGSCAFYAPHPAACDVTSEAAPEQSTSSLAFHPMSQLMVAQPRTLVTEDGQKRVERAEVGLFDAVNGEEGYGWISVDRALLASGIAFGGPTRFDRWCSPRAQS